MSRSVKKLSILKKAYKGSKKLANRKVRNFFKLKDFICNGCFYKRLYSQYDICDWIYKPNKNSDYYMKGFRK